MARPSRISILHGALILFALAIVGRAVKVQILDGSRWAEVARRQHFIESGLPATRGQILDASGATLVESRELVRISVAPGEVSDLRVLRSAMHDAGVEDRWVALATDPKRKWIDIPTPFLESDIAPILALSGVHPKLVVDRVYATTGGLRRITGRIDATGHGIDGIELALDSVLRGDSGTVTMARDKSGKGMDSPDSWGTIPQPGKNVVLTINRVLQEICERALASAVDSLHATGGDIVVMNPHTGEVLAMASKRADRAAFANTAVTEPFEPGSTLKPFIAASLLMRNRARPDEIIDTYNGQFVLDGRTITDIHKAKELSLADVIRFSSNIGIVRFSQRLSPREKFETLRDVGFGAPTGIPIPAEANGTLREPAKWSKTSAASLMMGYEIAVTPLQLVTAYSAIANGGELLEPRLVKEIKAPDGTLIYESRRRVVRRVMSTEVAGTVGLMLRGVVQGGTAMKADLVNFEVAGKSGTARRTKGGHYSAGNYTASFVGIFPGDNPQYVVLVKLDSPQGAYFGGEIAAPITRHILRAAIAARDAALDRGGLISAERKAPALTDSSLAVASNGSLQTQSAATQLEKPAEPALALIVPVDTVLRLPLSRPGTTSAQPARAVPDVSGLTLRQAVFALHNAGFRAGLSNVPGLIPGAGTMLPAGSVVHIGRMH
jgi:cell division protein FtsI (penicillin-binding protein 3)